MTLHDSGHAGPRTPRLRISWAVLALFAILAAGLSWPVIAHLTSRVPGTATWAFDESTFLWNIWYFKHALLDLHVSPLHTDLIWFPLGTNLTLYTFNFFNALVALPLLVATNLPLASNVTLLLATVLSAYGTYLLAYYVLRIAYCVSPGSARASGSRARLTQHASRSTQHAAHSTQYAVRNTEYAARNTEYAVRNTQSAGSVLRLAAIVAGLIYAFASNRAIYAALGHYNFATTQWVPFYGLYLLKTLRERRRKNALLAGLFFALAGLADMTYASLLGLFSAVVLLAGWRSLRPGRPALARLALAAVVALALWSPVLAPVVREFARSDYALSGWGETVKLSADLRGLLSPTDLNPLLRPTSGQPAANPVGPGTWGSDEGSPPGWRAELRAVEEGKGRFSDVNTVFLGYLTSALALVGAWRARRAAGAWIWSALVFGVLALGPLLQIGGRYRFSLDGLLPEGVVFPLPFTLLHFIPFLNANRAPNRNSLVLMLALAVLAAFGVAWLLGRVRELERRMAGDDGRAGGEASGRETLPMGKRTMGGREAGLVSHSPALPVSVSPALGAWLAPALTVVIALGLVLEHLAVPLPTTDARVPEIYTRIGSEPGDFSLLQLPLGWRNSFGVLGSERTQLQYYQSVHGKPIIGGNISRAPAFQMDYFARIPLFRALTELEMYHEPAPEIDAAARAQAPALMALYDVRYFITFPPIPGAYPYQDTWQRTQDYALQVLPLEKPAFWEQDGIKAYRVIQPAPAFPFRLDLGTAALEPYLGQGWDLNTADQPYGAGGFWATSTVAELYLPLDAPKDASLALRVAPLGYPGARPQTLSITVNDVPVLDRQTLAPGWQNIQARIPAAATRRGPNRVRLSFAWAVSPRQAFPDAASRAAVGLTGVFSPVNLDVHGFAEAYISAFMPPDGKEVKASPNRRGYNVVVIDPKNGRVTGAQGFDTAANHYESDRLASYLAEVPAGQIVALATKGDASAYLTPAALAALRGVGSRAAVPADLQGQAHALIGVRGAPAGTAAESIAPGDAFVRVAGDFRTLAAAVDWAEIGP